MNTGFRKLYFSCLLSVLMAEAFFTSFDVNAGSNSSPFFSASHNGSYRYILGPGDKLTISLFRLEDYKGIVEILADGTITLPRLGSVFVSGLTLDQAKVKLTNRYSEVFRRPIVYIDLLQSRPLRVSVSGQVQRPGIYTLSRSENQSLKSSGANTTNEPGATFTSSGMPTVVEAIQKAGGLTASGDLSRVTLFRSSVNGSEKKTELDFWQALRGNGKVYNPLLVDGDRIFIPTATNVSRENLSILGSSTFAPDVITVNVVGEVARPGPVQIKANSPLSTAILSSGGLNSRAKSTQLELLRVKPDGKMSSQSLEFSPNNTSINNENPSLRQGDVIVVNRHQWAKTTDTLRSVSEPLGSLLQPLSIFRVLGLPF